MFRFKPKSNVLIAFLLTSLSLIYLTFWFTYTNSHINESNLNSFYNPFLNALYTFKEFGLQCYKLCLESFFRVHFYPIGIIVFPLGVSTLNLEDLFLKYPWILNLFLTIVLSLIPFFAFSNNHKNKMILFYCLIYSSPITQVSLKAFSLHSWNVVLLVVSIFSYDAFLKKRQIKYLLFFILCAILSCSIKHLGLFYFIIFLCAQLTDVYVNKIKSSLAIISSVFILISSFIVYSNLSNSNYISFMFDHVPTSTLSPFLVIFVALLVLLVLNTAIFFLTVAKRKPYNDNDYISSPKFILYVFSSIVFFIYCIAGPFRDNLSDINLYSLVIFIFMLTICIINLKLLMISNTEDIFWNSLFFLSFSASFLLFLFAPFLEIFLFPTLILYYLYCKSEKPKCFIILFLLANIVLSNFHFSFYTKDLFFSSSWTPLSWKKSSLRTTHTSIKDIIKFHIPVHTKKYFLAKGLGYNAKRELNWLPYYDLTLLPPYSFKTSQLNAIHKEFDTWAIDTVVPFFIESLDDNPENKDIIQSFNTLSSTTEQKAIVQFVSHQYISYITQNSKLLNLYKTHYIPKENPSLKLYIHKNSSSFKDDIQIRYLKHIKNEHSAKDHKI